MGLGGLKSGWQRQTMHFGHENASRYSVLIMDNRGMGHSDKPAMRYSTSEMARDALEVLAHVGWITEAEAKGLSTPAGATQGRVLHIVGLSMGGMIAQELAWLVPDRISSLSLCCTAATIVSEGGFLENLAKRVQMLLPKSIEAGVRRASSQLFPPAWLRAADDVRLPDPGSTPGVNPPPPDANRGRYGTFDNNYGRFVAQELAKRLDGDLFTTKGFLLQLLAAGWHHKSPEQLRALGDRVGRERILVMHGTADGMISTPHGRRLIQMLQPGVGLIVEGMGHVPIMERWEWYNNLLAERFALGEKLDGRA